MIFTPLLSRVMLLWQWNAVDGLFKLGYKKIQNAAPESWFEALLTHIISPFPELIFICHQSASSPKTLESIWSSFRSCVCGFPPPTKSRQVSIIRNLPSSHLPPSCRFWDAYTWVLKLVLNRIASEAFYAEICSPIIRYSFIFEHFVGMCVWACVGMYFNTCCGWL